MSVIATLSFIARHPLTRDRRVSAWLRWLRWQVCKRWLPGPVAVPFVDATRLLIAPGMTGATGNYYCGLHEFEDMAFVLHFLRPGDLFIDVGANVGSYTVLASATGADVVSFEPVPAAFGVLRDNVNLNQPAGRVEVHNAAVGAAAGELLMTADKDTMNRVVGTAPAPGEAVARVPTVRIDDITGVSDKRPCVLKIDVEGYESQVLAGAAGLLASGRVQAAIVELNGSGARFGADDDSLHERLLGGGFTAWRYDPFARRLQPLAGSRNTGGNTLYLRDAADAAQRLASARQYHIATGGRI